MTTNEVENRDRFRYVFERVYNEGDLTAAEELAAPGFVNHADPASDSRGPEAMRAGITMLRAAFPDVHFTIHDLIAERETVAARVAMSGTHLGDFLGQPPTGRQFEQAQMHFVRFEDGRAVEHWAVRDDVGLLLQLGIMPPGAVAE